MIQAKVKVTEGGRIVIPVEFRRALGLHVGDAVMLRLEEDGIRVLTPRQMIRRAQALVRRYVREERSLTDELLAERRAETAQ